MLTFIFQKICFDYIKFYWSQIKKLQKNSLNTKFLGEVK